jgi:FHA domain
LDFHRFFDRFRRDRRTRGVRRQGPRSRDPRSDTEYVRAIPTSYAPPPPPPIERAVPPPAPAWPDPRPAPPLAQPAPPPPAAKPSDSGATRILSRDAIAHGAVKAVLIGIEGKLEGEIFKVRDGENRVGRAAGAEIRLDDGDDTISREHAVIIHREGAFGIKALKQDNPTWVNDEQVEGGTLSDGDRIRVGRNTFRFRVA